MDSAVTLAPLMHTFKWDHGDYDLLAAGSLAGHLIECGAQVTGGIFTDWELVPDWDNIGFPIVECYENGKNMVSISPIIKCPGISSNLDWMKMSHMCLELLYSTQMRFFN